MGTEALSPLFSGSRDGMDRRETGEFPAGLLLQEVYGAPRWIMTSKIGKKIVVTRCVSKAQNKIMPKMRLRLGLGRDPAGGAYSAPPDLHSWIWGRFASGRGKGGKGSGGKGSG